jgi:N-methylhydantoinase A
MNAFIGPRVRHYVQRLDSSLADAGLKADLRVMRSNGGLATPGTIAELPVLTLLSGPAAGVLGGGWSGALSKRRNLITFDIGGTSADIGVITEGRFGEASARDTWIGGYPIIVPMIDIHTIGAGGGSIAYVDTGGTFRVGPESAGAEPGPAAYGRGGTRPTVTDANVVLGRLDKDNFLGGAMPLDADAAAKAIEALAAELGLSRLEAAEGTLTVVNSNMANAIRSKTVQKGIDPRDYALVAFGGAGPLHGAEVARMLGIPEVIVPRYPGITSAMGLLTTDLKYDIVRTEFQVSTSFDRDRLNREFKAMREALVAQFAADGIAARTIRFERNADARYIGQGYELRVGIADGALGRAALNRMVAEFHETHRREYGHAFAESPVEIVNIRLTGVAPVPKIGKIKAPRGGSLKSALVKRDRSVFRHRDRLQAFDTAFYRRELLPIKTPVKGPAIILQTDSTTVVPPGCTITADESGNLVMKVGAA